MKKRTPVPAYILLLSLSNKLELLVNHYGTPCTFIYGDYQIPPPPGDRFNTCNFFQKMFSLAPVACLVISPLNFKFLRAEPKTLCKAKGFAKLNTFDQILIYNIYSFSK